MRLSLFRRFSRRVRTRAEIQALADEVERKVKEINARVGDFDLKRCSFCGKGREEVRRLIASEERLVLICDECVVLCSEILKEPDAEPSEKGEDEPPSTL